MAFNYSYIVIAIVTAFNSRDKVGWVSWLADAEDYVGRCHLQILPEYKAQGHGAVLLQQSGLKLHYGTEADALAFCFPQHYRPSNGSTTGRAAPVSERGAARLLSEAFC